MGVLSDEACILILLPDLFSLSSGDELVRKRDHA